MRSQDKRPEAVLCVHHVEEWEARVRTGRRQDLKESPMPVVVRIPIARAHGEAAPQPGPELGQTPRESRGLKPSLEIDSICKLRLRPPPAGLACTPRESINGPRRGCKNVQTMPAEGLDMDILRVAPAERQR